jgi:hypothetical protein
MWNYIQFMELAMPEVRLQHHTGRATDFDILPGQPVQPANTLDSFVLTAGKYQDTIKFQSGPLNGDPNGLTVEAVLETAAMRLESLNQGEFVNAHNTVAITKIRGAIDELKMRSMEREQRGVLGTEKA